MQFNQEEKTLQFNYQTRQKKTDLSGYFKKGNFRGKKEEIEDERSVFFYLTLSEKEIHIYLNVISKAHRLLFRLFYLRIIRNKSVITIT